MRYHEGMLPLFLVLSLWAGSFQRPADIVKWSAAAAPSTLNAGGIVEITLTARIENGWKLYALTQPQGGPKPLAIEVAAGAPFAISKQRIAAPKPKSMKDENFDLETLYYEGNVTFTVPVTSGKSATGTTAIPLAITFQACGNGICLRPFTQKVSAEVTVK
jgi:DsbC/DsbD-like thiol-disulfide interchange protein